jgi:hypothetical protein
MIQRISIFGVVVFLFIFFQSAFVLIEVIEHPHETVVTFCKAYYQLDESAKSLVANQDEIDMIDQFFYTQKQKANERGYRDSFLVSYMTDIHTETIEQTKKSAKVHIKARRAAIIPWLRTRKMYDVDHTFSLEKKDNQWVISGGIATM